MIPSLASRRTVRRSRSTVQVVACPRFRTRTTSPHGWVRLVAGIKAAAPDRTLQQIAAQLETHAGAHTTRRNAMASFFGQASAVPR
jgi:hypothetical protein